MAQNAYRGRTTRLDPDDLDDDIQDGFLNGKTRSADVLFALLRDTYYRGPISVGSGGTRKVYGSGSPGSGLRRPDGPFYDMPESWRKGILSRALDLDLIVRTDERANDEDSPLDDGTYATTPRGRDVLLDTDRCSECGHTRTPRISKSVIELSRYSHATDYSLITACPECEGHVGSVLEYTDDTDEGHGGRNALSHREERNANDEENVAVYANTDPSEFVEDPDEDTHSQDDEGGQDGSQDESEDTEDEATPDEDPAYEDGQTVRVGDSESCHSGQTGVIGDVRADGGKWVYEVRFDDGTTSTCAKGQLSTMRPVRESQSEPEGPEFEDDQRTAGGDAPPVEVVAGEFDTLETAVDKALSEGVENRAGEQNSTYMLEGSREPLERVYAVVEHLDYAYASTPLFAPLDGSDDECILLVQWVAPTWVAPDSTRGVYVCAECGAGEVRQDEAGTVTVSDLPATDAPNGWDMVRESDVRGSESIVVACAECGERGHLGDEDTPFPWTDGAIMSPTVHRTPPELRRD